MDETRRGPSTMTQRSFDTLTSVGDMEWKEEYCTKCCDCTESWNLILYRIG